MDADERVEAVLNAPAAATMFLLARHWQLKLDDLAAPASATLIGAAAANALLNPWTGGAGEVRAVALAEVSRVRAFIVDVLADPRNAWWFGPMDRSAQLHLGDDRDALTVISSPAGARNNVGELRPEADIRALDSHRTGRRRRRNRPV